MALQKSYTDNTGVIHANAYHNISDIVYSKRDNEVFANINIYHNKQARDDGYDPIIIAQYKTSIIGTVEDAVEAMDGGDGIRPYIYTRLKTLPEYDGAIDV